MRVAFSGNQMWIRTRCRNVDQLVCTFKRYVNGNSVFLSSPCTRAIGTEMHFVTVLSDETIALRGLGVIGRAWVDARNPFGRPGFMIEVRALTRNSMPIFDQMRAPASAHGPNPEDVPIPPSPRASHSAQSTEVRNVWTDDPHTILGAAPAAARRPAPSAVDVAAGDVPVEQVDDLLAYLQSMPNADPPAFAAHTHVPRRPTAPFSRPRKVTIPAQGTPLALRPHVDPPQASAREPCVEAAPAPIVDEVSTAMIFPARPRRVVVPTLPPVGGEVLVDAPTERASVPQPPMPATRSVPDARSAPAGHATSLLSEAALAAQIDSVLFESTDSVAMIRARVPDDPAPSTRCAVLGRAPQVPERESRDDAPSDLSTSASSSGGGATTTAASGSVRMRPRYPAPWWWLLAALAVGGSGFAAYQLQDHARNSVAATATAPTSQVREPDTSRRTRSAVVVPIVGGRASFDVLVTSRVTRLTDGVRLTIDVVVVPRDAPASLPGAQDIWLTAVSR